MSIPLPSVKITIKGIEYDVPGVVFRRLMTTARADLQVLQKDEGANFPQVDRDVLKLIATIQSKHLELI